MDAAAALLHVLTIRMALELGDLNTAHREAVSLEGKLRAGLTGAREDGDTLLTGWNTDRAQAGLLTDVRTVEKATPYRVAPAVETMNGPTRFALLAVGAVEGPTITELYSTARNDSERARLLAWLGGTPDIAEAIGTLLTRFPPR
jgi:hypothetical protein